MALNPKDGLPIYEEPVFRYGAFSEALGRESQPTPAGLKVWRVANALSLLSRQIFVAQHDPLCGSERQRGALIKSRPSEHL